LLYDAVAAEPAAARKPATHTVLIDGVKYVPETLTVKRGDTIVWINKDPFPHTVTSSGAFDSHAIAADKSWKLKPRKAGDYAYVCTLHPNMTGQLKVE
jgi:plastocyanin